MNIYQRKYSKEGKVCRGERCMRKMSCERGAEKDLENDEGRDEDLG
jgi:hypothetical protein